MQLSLPIPVLPAPPVAPGGKKNSSPADSGSENPSGTAAAAFESLLNPDAPAEPADEVEEGPDRDKTADIPAVMFWMPVAPAATPPPADILAPDAIDAAPEAAEQAGNAAQNEEAPGAENNSRPGVGFGFNTVRSFVPAGSVVDVPRTPTSMKDRNPAIPLQTEPQPDAPVVQPVVAAKMPDAGTPDVATPGTPASPPITPALANTPAKNATPASDAAATLVSPSFAGEDAKPNPNPIVQAASVQSAATVPQPANRPEKFAAPPPPADNQPVVEKSDREKHFLRFAHKSLTAVADTVGIAVAKASPVMSAVVNPAKEVPSDGVAAAFSFSAENAPWQAMTPDAPAPAATVRETMKAVISAVDALERQANVEHKRVDLQFQVGNERLGLRVELREGVVHTTFRTESSEMNRALSREWHLVVPSAAAGEIRVAEPVFNSSGSHQQSASGSPGHGAPQHHREQQPSRPSFAPIFGNQFHGPAAVAPAAVSAPRAANSSQLLNALA